MIPIIKKYKKTKRRALEEIITSGGGMEMAVFNDPISYPLTVGSGDVEFRGGLIDADTSALINEAILLRYNKPCQSLPEDYSWTFNFAKVSKRSGVFLFGGVLFDNFGHFLLESLSRLWGYSMVKEIEPFIFFYAPWGIPDYKKKGHYIFQAFKALDIPVDKIVFFDHVVQLEKVVVPEQKYGFGKCRTPDSVMIDFIRTFQLPGRLHKTSRAEKVYVSRSQLPYQTGRPIAEALFEEYLKLNGYLIVYPEKLALYEQLTLYKQAQRIIFCDGGATYCNVLLPGFVAEVAVIARRRDPRWNYKEITDHFMGYKKDILWIDEVIGQYQFGLETWDALAEVDWHKVSIALKEQHFTETIFEIPDTESYKSIKEAELRQYIKSIESNPLFIQYMQKRVENHPCLPNSF